MSGLSSLDRKDRGMLIILVSIIVVLLLVLAIYTPSNDTSNNPIPGTYFAGQHGAKAAYTLLEQSGYTVERWEEPLKLLVPKADENTVLILAQPYSDEEETSSYVADILQKGAWVLTTDYGGGALLPRNQVEQAKGFTFAACEAQPQGLRPLASSGSIWMVRRAGWKINSPEYRVDYACGDQPVVVEYSFGKGHIIWWAGSTPLENGSIQRTQNMELLLNSIGPRMSNGKVRHIYWDESLHGDSHTPWDYTSGPVWLLLLFGSIGLAVLVIFSYSRRSGPMRALPTAPRATPIEFLDALGSLYRSAGANATAVQIAWERFRSQAALMSGQRNLKLGAHELAQALDRRFGSVANGMEADLIEAEEASWNEELKPREALGIVQALHRHEATLRAASSSRAKA